MEMIGVLVVLAMFLLPAALWIWAIIDIIKSDFSGNNKIIWLLIVILVPLLGIILYAFIGRKQKTKLLGSTTGDKFCQSCGEKLPLVAAVCSKCNAPQPVTKKSNNTVAIVVALCLVLFVGVGFIGILAAIAIPQFSSYRVKGYDSAAQSDLKNIKTGLESYYADHGYYPTSISDATYTPSKDVEVVAERLDPKGYIIVTGHKSGTKWYMANSDETKIYYAPKGDEKAEYLPM